MLFLLLSAPTEEILCRLLCSGYQCLLLLSWNREAEEEIAHHGFIICVYDTYSECESLLHTYITLSIEPKCISFSCLSIHIWYILDVFIYIHIYMYVCIYLCAYMYLCIYLCVDMHVCMYISMCIHVCMYIYIHVCNNISIVCIHQFSLSMLGMSPLTLVLPRRPPQRETCWQDNGLIGYFLASIERPILTPIWWREDVVRHRRTWNLICAFLYESDFLVDCEACKAH